jgi:hypothetical protein
MDDPSVPLPILEVFRRARHAIARFQRRTEVIENDLARPVAGAPAKPAEASRPGAVPIW